ncbi:hypothetical protein [Alsobacter sp. R-9]
MPKLSPLVLAAIGLAGCAPAAPIYLAAPADPTRAVRPLSAAPVSAGSRSFAIVEPKGWDELNRNVAPKGATHAP